MAFSRSSLVVLAPPRRLLRSSICESSNLASMFFSANSAAAMSLMVEPVFTCSKLTLAMRNEACGTFKLGLEVGEGIDLRQFGSFRVDGPFPEFRVEPNDLAAYLRADLDRVRRDDIALGVEHHFLGGRGRRSRRASRIITRRTGRGGAIGPPAENARGRNGNDRQPPRQPGAAGFRGGTAAFEAQRADAVAQRRLTIGDRRGGFGGRLRVVVRVIHGFTRGVLDDRAVLVLDDES